MFAITSQHADQDPHDVVAFCWRYKNEQFDTHIGGAEEANEIEGNT